MTTTTTQTADSTCSMCHELAPQETAMTDRLNHLHTLIARARDLAAFASLNIGEPVDIVIHRLTADELIALADEYGGEIWNFDESENHHAFTRVAVDVGNGGCIRFFGGRLPVRQGAA